MDSLVCIRIKCHRLILIADLEDRIFNGAIVEAKGNLLQIAKATCPIRIIQVGVHPVVPDHSGERRSSPNRLGESLVKNAGMK